jgi:phosphoribosylanthranilate isomerase
MIARVKVCGITNLDDALCAVVAGADALGFIFVEGTPRHVTPDRAARIVAGLPPGVLAVGVFWDHEVAHIEAVADACRLGAVQLHGAEPPETVRALSRPVLKTVKLGGPDDLSCLDRYRPAAFLLDSPARWSEGEARRPVSWTLAAEAARRAPVLLSAGLTPDTVADAIRAVRPGGVDVNSGVEGRPGRKDPDKVRAAGRAAGRRGAPAPVGGPGRELPRRARLTHGQASTAARPPWPLRAVRRPLRARDAHDAAPRAGARVPGRAP